MIVCSAFGMSEPNRPHSECIVKFLYTAQPFISRSVTINSVCHTRAYSQHAAGNNSETLALTCIFCSDLRDKLNKFKYKNEARSSHRIIRC